MNYFALFWQSILAHYMNEVLCLAKSYADGPFTLKEKKRKEVLSHDIFIAANNTW
jgi:hypothetical protein